MLTFYQLPPVSGGKPGHAVILLHGLGDHGQGGLLSIAAMWQAALPDTEFICPDAPFAFDMAPPDFGGRQWFSLKDFSPAAMLEGAKTAAPYLNEFIGHILSTRNLPPEKLALVGFSQGTMMALYVALQKPEKIAGIVGYSGLLLDSDNVVAWKKSAPPVLLVHGTADEVVPFASMALAADALKKAGIPVTTLTCHGTGHSVDERGLAAGLKFLTEILR